MATTIQKAAVIVFLVLLVIGFVVPGIFYVVQDEPAVLQNQQEIRLCIADTDCSLECDGQTVPVLCYRNTCQQKACEDVSPVGAYGSGENTFSLAVNIGNQSVNLTGALIDTSSLSYVALNDDGSLTSHASGLALSHVLDKFRMALDTNCLFAEGKALCRDTGNVTLLINGQANAPYASYVPQDGDKIAITYEEFP